MTSLTIFLLLLVVILAVGNAGLWLAYRRSRAGGIDARPRSARPAALARPPVPYPAGVTPPAEKWAEFDPAGLDSEMAQSLYLVQKGLAAELAEVRQEMDSQELLAQWHNALLSAQLADQERALARAAETIRVQEAELRVYRSAFRRLEKDVAPALDARAIVVP
jgi:hypothetical protein